ncbi:ribosomal protein L7/L12 [Paenibacillus xylanilyticus]|uniref:ribosomal protein L7/L12 n=1 Tax=Paenibacillus xylanilyticus TaxID=248903 RepID=UPI0039A0AF8C
MEINTVILIVLLLLVLVLLIRVISLQSQLNELKRDVERIENGTGMTPRSNVNYSSLASTLSSAPDSQTELSQLDHELLVLIQQGQKIKAIKKLREARDLSLKDAKDYVDALDRT